MQDLLLEKLRRVTRSLLDGSRPAYSLRNEVLELKSIFEKAGGSIADKARDIAAGETRTARGVAISPTMASMCLEDYSRTVQFIRSIHDAILDLRKQIDDRPVRVLYAGCGPWATLAIPVISIFPASEVKFTLLDIHEASIATARSLIYRLGLSDSIENCETLDAADYTIEADGRPDIILIEMLRAGLDAEPQVAVAMQLFREAPDATMIPDEVRIDLVLINQSREFTFDGSMDSDEIVRDRIDVGEVFVLNKSALESWVQSAERPPLRSLTFPEFDEQIYRPMLTTTIRVYGEHLLKDYDAGITCPKALPSDVDTKSGATLEFSYEIGERPGLRTRTR